MAVMNDDENYPLRPVQIAIFRALIVCGSFLVQILIAEVVLRFLPVANGFLAMPVNAAQPMLRYVPNQQFVFSRDWNFSIVNRGRVNNDGFVNDEDYVENDNRPLVAVIGDSQVEAAMVPNEQTFYRRHAEQLRDKGRVYSFGVSGAPLSQYLVWAQYAAQRYRASAIVISVVYNDFDESLSDYSRRPGVHVYARGADSHFHLARIDYEPSSFRRFVARYSALARYLAFNLDAFNSAVLVASALGLTSSVPADPRHSGHTADDASSELIRDSQEAVGAFFDDLSKMVLLPPERIVFMVDGAHYQADVASTEQSFFGRMRRYLMTQASERGYEVIDLQPLFVAGARDGRTTFEFPTDGHWNATAHALVAEALGASRLYRTLFGPK